MHFLKLIHMTTYYYATCDDPYNVGGIHKASDMNAARRGAVRVLMRDGGSEHVGISRTGDEYTMMRPSNLVGYVERLETARGSRYVYYAAGGRTPWDMRSDGTLIKGRR